MVKCKRRSIDYEISQAALCAVKMAALFGIHVGNSSASLAIFKDEDRVDIVANDAGERVTPTIVQWTPTNCIVGRAAQIEQFRHTTCTVIRNKQLLNENISQSEFDGLKSKITYKVNRTETNIKYELLFEGKQHHVSPREIVSFIFKKIFGIAEAAVGGSKEMNAVLCVPLYFSSKSIELIKDVATKAGFKIIQVIDEPCAAALGYNLTVEPEESLSYCLVYRVGGVSIDATILLIQDGMFSVLGSVHKHNLGGSLLTESLSEFLATEFKRQFKTIDITERGKFKLLAAAENVKQILSIQNVAQCSAESIGGGYDLSCSVSRARFENIMLQFIPEMLAPISEVLNQTGLSVNQINKVIGCGGSLKIPKLQENICSLFPTAEALMKIAPDELIALGAAKQAGYCIKHENFPESLAIDTPALSYSLLLTVRQGNSNEEKSYSILKNSSVPLRRRYNVPTSENSVSVDVDIPEKNNLNLGSVSLDELEPNSTVTVELDINKDGKLLLNLVNEASSRKNCLKFDLNEMPIS